MNFVWNDGAFCPRKVGCATCSLGSGQTGRAADQASIDLDPQEGSPGSLLAREGEAVMEILVP